MFRSLNLFSTSVGGVDFFTDFGSLCVIMVSTVDCMVLPRRIPRCLELSRVVPRRCKCSQSGAGVLMHNAVVLAMLLFSPLTPVYLLYCIMRECNAVEKETSRKLTVAGLPKATMTM